MSEPVERPAWTSTTVLRILRDPRLAGYAIEWEGRKQRTKDEDGRIVPGSTGRRAILRDSSGAPLESHEPLIPPADWWALQDVLNGRSKTVERRTGRVPTLLAGHGFLFCDVCGSVMVAGLRGQTRYYQCNRAGGVVAGHGGLVINMEQADDETARRVWARLTAMDPDDPEDREWLAEAARRLAHQRDTSGREAELAAARSELEHVRTSLRTLYEDRTAGAYVGTVGTQVFRDSVERLTAHEQRTTDRIKELEQAAAGAVAIPDDWTGVIGDPLGPGSTWAKWQLQKRREFLDLFVDSVRITKATGRGRNANTTDRIVIRWAERPEVI